MKMLCDILDNKNIKYKWYVLGKAFTQDIENEIKKLFEKNNNVYFLGYQKNVYSYISRMDYLALLSDREAWGLVISEALILGVPVLVTNFDGVDKQIEDKKNGIIFEMTDENNKYSSKVDEMLLLKEKLKCNVEQDDYSRDYIIDRWGKLLSE